MAHSKGLHYKKIDFHIHTPASKCYKNIENLDDTNIPKAIVDKAIAEGLSAIAITDHNTGEYVDKIKEAARGTALTVFPGVEITSGDAKSHIIAILGEEKGTSHITDLLAQLKIGTDQRGKKEAFTTASVDDVINLVTNNEFQGIAVPAHINSTNGVFDTMKGEQRISIVQNKNLIAVESTDYKHTSKLLNGNDPNYKRKLAVYQSSDNPALLENGKRDESHAGSHNISGIGNRYTLLKLDDKITLDAIKQCFHDPDVRVRFPDDMSKKQFPKITKIAINSGFLEGTDIKPHKGLNCLIGAKGAGKSLLIELIRFALNKPTKISEIKKDHEGKLAELLKTYGTVTIDVEDSIGNEYCITRTYDINEDHPIVCIAKSTGEPYGGNIETLFPVLVLSQNEIIRIAENRSNEIMEFIDSFFDFKHYRNKINSIEDTLARLDTQFSLSLRSKKEQKTTEADLASAKTDLQRISQKLEAPILEEFSKWEKQEEHLQLQKHIFEQMSEVLETAKTEIQKIKIPAISEDLQNPPISRNNQIITDQKQNLITQIEANEIATKTALREAQNDIDSWMPNFNKIKEEYKKFIIKSGGNLQELEGTRKQKKKEIQILEDKLVKATSEVDKIKTISEKRNQALDELKRVYSEYFEERKTKCQYFENSSKSKLQIKIEEATNVQLFKEELLKIKVGSRIHESNIDKVSNLSPYDFVRTFLLYQWNKSEENDRNDELIHSLINGSDIEASTVRTLFEFMSNKIETGELSYERLLSLQYKTHPSDTPIISYNISSDQRTPQFKELSKLSTGQKCTAMLILALADGEFPVIIDQPEDSLDIKGVWTDMCEKLRETKETRQFVFTTHNSSLAVASDTDKFFVITSNGQRATVDSSGAMDTASVRKEVVEYLEGGNTAYNHKIAKYNYDTDTKKFK